MIRKATAIWNGGLKDGKGALTTTSGVLKDTQYSFSDRFEQGTGTNPEELIGAAHAGCYSMHLSGGLAAAGFAPERISTTARVHLEKVDAGFKVVLIELETEARVPGIDEKTFQDRAQASKVGCPISQALAATEIKLTARLL